MSVAVLFVVLLAAALHAAWNAIVKGGGEPSVTMDLVLGAAALLAGLCLPLLSTPAAASWPFIAVSAAVHVGYFLLVARTYRIADMGEAYPVMRGTAPLLVAGVGVAFLGERLPPLAWTGIAAICLGIVAMAFARGRALGPGVRLALGNAAVIATYTLIDGAGVRRSGAPAAYTTWMFLLTGAPVVGWGFASRRAALQSQLARRWPAMLAGGFGTVASYGLVLWAMTMAPVAIVAALRETAILFATAISVLVLKERADAARLAGACIIVAGIVALKLA